MNHSASALFALACCGVACVVVGAASGEDPSANLAQAAPQGGASVPAPEAEGSAAPAPAGWWEAEFPNGITSLPPSIKGSDALIHGPAGSTRDACDDPVCTEDSIDREMESNCGLPTDTVNGGCNFNPILTTPIFFGEKLCGSVASTGIARDLDWYKFTVTETTTITYRARAQFDMLAFIGASNFCTAHEGYGFTTFECGVLGEITLTLAPDDYFLVMSSLTNPPVECGSQYMLQLLDTSACGEPVCDFDAIDREDEHTCDVSDTVNGGCSESPFRSTPISVGEKLCGTFASSTGQDSDWYDFTLAGAGAVSIHVRAEGECEIELATRISAGDECADFAVQSIGSASACQPHEFTTPVLPAGEHYVILRGGSRCGEQYQLELSDSTSCGGPVCDPGSVARENEPGCGLPDDFTNGGCESIADGYGFLSETIALDETVCGALGAIDSIDRDNDYYELSLAAPTQLFIGAIAEVPINLEVLSFIDPNDNCLGAQVIASANGAECGLAEIAPVVNAGTYYIRIAPDVDGPVPCGRAYTLTVIGTRLCIGDLNGDGITNSSDFNILAGNFGAGPGATQAQGDLTGDGFVNSADFNVLAGDFGCAP